VSQYLLVVEAKGKSTYNSLDPLPSEKL